MHAQKTLDAHLAEAQKIVDAAQKNGGKLTDDQRKQVRYHLDGAERAKDDVMISEKIDRMRG